MAAVGLGLVFMEGNPQKIVIAIAAGIAAAGLGYLVRASLDREGWW